MVPLVSFLAALRILTEAQICNNGEGKVVFEKVTAFQSTPPEFLTNSSQFEIITRTNVPPLKVLEECFHRCQEDRVNKIGVCNKFDFLPGKRLSEPQSNLRKRTPKNVGDIKGKLLNVYDQSSCVLYNQANGTINWDDISPNHGSPWQFDKVCLSAQHVNKNCPNRPFVYEKIPAYKLIDTEKGKELTVTDKNECENKCLMEREFTCRSASFKSTDNKCFISPLNRHVAPGNFKSDPDFEYLENMCLKNNDMCKWSVLIIENNKQLDSSYEKHSTTASSVNNCSTSCLESLDKFGFVCRSFMFDEQSQQCILYDEDPMDMAANNNETDTKLITSEGNLYRVLCSTDEKDKDLDNKTLECYRHKRLRGRHQMEIYAMNFYECLSGCMRKFGSNCRSIEYSHAQKICRFSAGTVVGPVSQKDSEALIDDDSFDYYQFMWNDELSNVIGPLSDRHDAIETSYSQPGNYKNFILPSERARDHHRGGFAYNTNDVRQPPSLQPTSTNQNNLNNNVINPSPAYTFQIEQKQQPDSHSFDRTGTGTGEYPSRVSNSNGRKPQQPESNQYDGANQIYPQRQQQQPGQQHPGSPYDPNSPNYNMNQIGGKPQPDYRTFDPNNNQIYSRGQGQPGANQYDRSGTSQIYIPQQRETEFNSFDGTPSIYPMPTPTQPGQLDRYQMNQNSDRPEPDSSRYDPANSHNYPFQPRSQQQPAGSSYGYDPAVSGYLMPSRTFGPYNQITSVSSMSSMPYMNYDQMTPGSSMSSRPYINYDIRPSQPINSVYPSSTYIYQIEQKQQSPDSSSDEYGNRISPSSSIYPYSEPRRPGSSSNDYNNNKYDPASQPSYSLIQTNNSRSNGFDVRPSSRTNIVYPSQNYVYHVEQQKQQPDGIDNQIPMKPYQSGSDPNKYDGTSQIQSQIFSVPSNKQKSSYYTIQHYRQSQPDLIDFKISPTPTIRPQSVISSSTIYSGADDGSGRGSIQPVGMVNNQSTIMNSLYPPATPNPIYSQNSNGFKPRTSSIQYPSQGYQSFGHSMGRTPVVANGGFPLNNFGNFNGFMSYGPYGTMGNNGLPFSGVHQTQINTLPSNHIGQNPTPIAYDRYGQLPPSGSSQSSSSGISAMTSGGCSGTDYTGIGPSFKKMGFSARLKSKHIYKVARAERLEDCERYCLETKDFICKSFNYRPFFPDNCELSNVDTKKFKLDDANHFEHNTQFDYYERDEHKTMMMMTNSMDCFEVLQTCSPEGMELKLKTPEGFYGRIYTYGFYDSCFFDGNGGTTSVLKISKPNGFPRCGTQQISPDAMTNIVVVQFNDFVQTSRDKKYNLTCYISGPGEAVVTSNYLDTKTDGRHPMQIEHLPAQNVLTSNIVLRILYRGTPTNTIVVGDLLTFRLEARNQYRFNGYYNDIFATNVIAKDPYTGRQVLLIDSRGCPVDLYVFPELHKTPDGALEAEFYAFKIPDSNFLVFQATVKTCKGPCEPVICTERNRGQSFSSGTKGAQMQNMVSNYPSWGRRRRSIDNLLNSNSSVATKMDKGKRKSNKNQSGNSNKIKEEEEEVHELLRVYLQPEDVPESQMLQRPPEPLSSPSSMDKMCLDKTAYHLLMTFSILFVLLFTIILPYCLLAKWMKSRYESNNKEKQFNSMDVHGWMSKWPRMSSFMMKSKQSTPSSTFNPTIYGQRTQHFYKNDYQPPQKRHLPIVTNYSEPIYQDLQSSTSSSSSAIERSRSLQSLTIQDQCNNKTRINVNYE